MQVLVIIQLLIALHNMSNFYSPGTLNSGSVRTMLPGYESSLGDRNAGLFPQNRPFSGGGFYEGEVGAFVGRDPMYVDPYRSGDRAAQETLADLYEAEFQDYLSRFFPIEQDLINQMTTDFSGLQQEEINRAQAAVARQFATSRGSRMRRMASFGLNRGGNQFANDLSRNEVSATVAARNFARERSEQRRLEILSGGLGSSIRDRSITGATV